MRSETGKRPKGQSFVMKPSWLQAALEASGLTIDTELTRSHSQIFFDAHFWPPINVPYDRLYARAGTVPSAQAEVARAFTRNAVLPQLIDWISRLVKLDPKSPARQHEHYFRAWFEMKDGEAITSVHMYEP